MGKRRILTALLAACCLTGAAEARQVQEDTESRAERRIKVVVSDGEMVTEEKVWIDDETAGDAIFLGSAGGPEGLELHQYLSPRAFLGVRLIDITPELRRHFGAANEDGVLVSAVAEDSPAAAAGIEVGDVLTHIDGKAVGRAGEVIRVVGRRGDGETVSIDLVRDRRSLAVTATLAERPRSQVDLAPMFWAPGDAERHVLRLPDHVIEIETGDLDTAISELHERLTSPEWRQKLEETHSRRKGLESRILELELKLKEMEKKLEEGG